MEPGKRIEARKGAWDTYIGAKRGGKKRERGEGSNHTLSGLFLPSPDGGVFVLVSHMGVVLCVNNEA